MHPKHFGYLCQNFCNKRPVHCVFLLQHFHDMTLLCYKRLGRLLFLILTTLLTLCLSATAQERKLQHRPYIDQRRFHYGFFIGGHGQSFNISNNALIQSSTGRQWFAVNDRYDLGFQVGVLGEWRLTPHLALRLSPSIFFGNQHIVFRDQPTGDQLTQSMKTALVTLPLEVKIAAPRFNNYRPYVITGIMPSYDLTRRQQDRLYTKPFNTYLTIGAGCDLYLPFFKCIPELKFAFGLRDILQRHRPTLIDQSQMIFTESIDRATSSMVMLTLYFE